jgi:hypothetical protein
MNPQTKKALDKLIAALDSDDTATCLVVAKRGEDIALSARGTTDSISGILASGFVLYPEFKSLIGYSLELSKIYQPIK